MTFLYFTDRDLGNLFPNILRSAGLTVEQHRDHFVHNASDEEWLEEIGRRRWVALTHNSRIRYTPNELEAVIRHNVALLVIVGNAPHSELAHAFVATVPRIERFLRQNEPPFIAKVYRPSAAETARRHDVPGRIEPWFPFN